MEHREKIVRSRAHVRQGAHLFGNHAQLFEIDETIHASIVAQVNECQILLDNREEWNLYNLI